MTLLCFNIVSCIIEFFKLYLFTTQIFRVKVSNKIFLCFPLSLFPLSLLSDVTDISSFSSIAAMLIIALLFIFSFNKRKIGLIILSFLAIGIFDFLFSSICIVIFHLNENDILHNFPLTMGLNSVALIILVITSLILSRKNCSSPKSFSKKYLPVYLLGGFALFIYLSAIQVLGMGEKVATVKEGMTFAAFLCCIVLIVLVVLLVSNSTENEQLKQETIFNQAMLEAQQKYYTMLLQKENETKAFRHDIKGHIYCMTDLYTKGNFKELGIYLSNLNEYTIELTPKVNTGHALVNAIANDISSRFPNVDFEWNHKLPNELNISPLDICTIFYNLLSNAFEASCQCDNGFVTVKVEIMDSILSISIKNSMLKPPVVQNDHLVSEKPGDRHGFGIKNVKNCITKYNGDYFADWHDNIFKTELVIPNII